jgi:DNA helicase-2/ATP-dependent DNA helicase PcrA
METQREIPEYLGDIINPLVEEYKKSNKVKRSVGFEMFMNFIGRTPLLAHNAEYDYNILKNNLKRYCDKFELDKIVPVYFDSLKLSKIIEPKRKNYKLKTLLSELGLEGENTHLADDDVVATISLIGYLFQKVKKLETNYDLSTLIQNKSFNKFLQQYQSIYVHTKNNLYTRSRDEALLVNEFRYVYHMIRKPYLRGDDKKRNLYRIDKIDKILRHIKLEMLNIDFEPSLKEQLDNHLIELLTFKEVNLCDSSLIKERVFVSTIHKAKGLEFENIILPSVNKGVYPPKRCLFSDENARLLYVALSRAKKRIYITFQQGYIKTRKVKVYTGEEDRFGRERWKLQDVEYVEEVGLSEFIDLNKYIKYGAKIDVDDPKLLLPN